MPATPCCIINCHGSTHSKHRFPNPYKDRDIFDKWVDLSGNKRLALVPPDKVKNYRVCSLHFLPEDFGPNHIINRDAVPSLNLPEKIENANEVLADESSELMEAISQRGNTVMVKKLFRYKEEARKLTTGETKWRCIKVKCNAYLKTMGERGSRVLTNKNEMHSHEPDPEHLLQRQMLSQSTRRKAESDITEKPSKIIRKSMAEKTSTGKLTARDIHCVRRNIYYRRRKLLQGMPLKTAAALYRMKMEPKTNSASATATSNTRLELPIQGPSGQGADPSDPFLELPSTSNRPVNKRRRQNTDSYEDDSTTDSSKPIQMPIDDVVGLTDVKCELDENMSDSDSLMEIVKHEIEDYIPDVPDSVSPQEIEAILINDDDDDVDTESPQNIKLIKTKEEPEKNHFDDRHPVDVFCKSVALSLKSLRSDLCNEGKIRIMQLISELEQRNALPNENPSTSRTINNRAEPTSTVTRNLILKKELD